MKEIFQKEPLRFDLEIPTCIKRKGKDKQILFASLIDSKLKSVEYLDDIAVPEVWTIENNTFSDIDYEPPKPEDLEYIGKEGNLDVYFDKKIGKKVYLGRGKL